MSRAPATISACLIALLVTAGCSEAESQGEGNSYFAKFYNPTVVRALAEKNIGQLRSLPPGVADSVILYVLFASDKVEEQCGAFLSLQSTVIRGTLRLALAAYSVVGAVNAVQQEPNVVGTSIANWIIGLQSIKTIETQAGRDMSLFLGDQGSCVSKAVYDLQDGMDLLFRTPSPNSQNTGIHLRGVPLRYAGWSAANSGGGSE